ncbi:hypothetical protein STEG23_030585, partial [Scotinomys teguina]
MKKKKKEEEEEEDEEEEEEEEECLLIEGLVHHNLSMNCLLSISDIWAQWLQLDLSRSSQIFNNNLSEMDGDGQETADWDKYPAKEFDFLVSKEVAAVEPRENTVGTRPYHRPNCFYEKVKMEHKQVMSDLQRLKNDNRDASEKFRELTEEKGFYCVLNGLHLQ